VHTTQHQNAWEKHWSSLDGSGPIFGFLSTLTRRILFQPAVSFYVERFFSRTGVFVEMGCGTADSSASVVRGDRRLLGLDFSAAALEAANRVGRMDALIRADMFAVPLKCHSVAGIWNLGVMEHFTETEIRLCLREFRRVLTPGGTIILFWPAERNLSRWVLGPLEWATSRVRGSGFAFFPDEINRLRSKRHARELVGSEGFEIKAVDFNWRTAFIHMVIAATV
jgi:SAM-dependent methyltransferase